MSGTGFSLRLSDSMLAAFTSASADAGAPSIDAGLDGQTAALLVARQAAK